MKIKRVYHHYLKCEEYKSNMWKSVPADMKDHYISASAKLMINVAEFEKAMMRAINEWPFSCEANLTAPTINHQAWIGHAGCAIAVESPEDLTRLGWRTLTSDQQDLANMAADGVIAEWKRRYLNAKA